ncbi:hypothetical protein J132_11083 [Termitomyces sp. J132]|nr:hypothetical protein J132_11083 [Termitomyces sp. J132]
MCLKCVSAKPHDRAIQFESIIDHIIDRLESILDNNEDLPLILPWVPKTADNEVIAHCQKLKIPKLHNKPCLLLHELGRLDGSLLNRPNDAHGEPQLEQWPERDERLQLIFHSKNDTKYHSVLLNTSGSGKTRLVLEGLCSEWGFYFTCSRRSDEIGSSDIQAIIGETGCFEAQQLARELPVLPQEITIETPCEEAKKLKEALQYNVRIANRCFEAVMVARLLVFSCFLNAAKHKSIGVNLLKKTWLFVQLDTRLLGDDLFMELTCVLSTIEQVELLSRIGGHLFTACERALLELDHRAILYCVVDEAQTAVEAWSSSFRNKLGRINRPALRPMLFRWQEQYNLRTIVTGTSINYSLIKEALGSTVAKEADDGLGVTSTGSSYLQSPSGRELLERARYWLWGRPRFIAAFVQLVIQNEFRSYHRLLSQCVRDISNFVPTDGVDWESQEPDIMSDASVRLCPFDYQRVSEIKYQLIDSVQNMTYERLMSGNLDFLTTLKVTNWALVECGFARFPGAKIEDGNPLFDEPLAYLAADIWINSQKDLWKQRHEFFVEQIGKHSPHANGLERYIALVLAEAFRGFTQLSNVFDFASTGIDRNLAEQRARLVSCWHDSSEIFRVAPTSYPIETELHAGRVVLGPSSPCHRLGYKAPTKSEHEGDLQWLAGRNRAPFLFPMEQLGPDVMFRLQLERTKEIITVALQVKHRATSLQFSAESDIRDAIRSVTPRFFWKDVNGNAHGPHDILKCTANTLSNFPGRFNPNEAGYSSVLRALFVFPAEFNTTTCHRIKEVAVKLQHDLTSQGLVDRHDICVIPTASLLKLREPIKKGLMFILARAKQHAIESRKAASKWNMTQTDTPSKADIISQLKLSRLSKLKSHELGDQLLFHRQLEAIRAGEGGPVHFLTPHPYDMKKADRLLALRSAIRRYNDNEERLRARRQR